MVHIAESELRSHEKLKPSFYQVTVVEGGSLCWLKYGRSINTVLYESFINDFCINDIRKMINGIEWDSNNTRTRIFLLHEQMTGLFIGFSSWFPSSYSDGVFYQPFLQYCNDPSVHSRDVKQQTAEIGWTAILPQWRGRGGWSCLMDQMEDDLIDHHFVYQIRTARDANAYKEKLTRRYGNQIIKTEPILGWGHQTRYWIVL